MLGVARPLVSASGQPEPTSQTSAMASTEPFRRRPRASPPLTNESDSWATRGIERDQNEARTQ